MLLLLRTLDVLSWFVLHWIGEKITLPRTVRLFGGSNDCYSLNLRGVFLVFCFRILGIDGKESLFFGAAFCFFFSESLNCVLVLVNGMLVQYMQNGRSSFSTKT